jgi:hypothetical protein
MIVLDSVVGHTVEQTIARAREMVVQKQQSVLVEINDIMMLVDNDLTQEQLMEQYIQKLVFRYEITNIKQARQR